MYDNYWKLSVLLLNSWSNKFDWIKVYTQALDILLYHTVLATVIKDTREYGNIIYRDSMGKKMVSHTFQ